MSIPQFLPATQRAYSHGLKEIILHSLLESGVSQIQGLEKYITDDVARHGNRLNELEKKITNVYQEFTSTEAIDDDTLFANEDDEEEESAFVMCAPDLLALGGCNADFVVCTGVNLRTTLERISWAYASWVLPPSSVFPLSRSPNVSSGARGMPKVQMQRMIFSY